MRKYYFIVIVFSFAFACVTANTRLYDPVAQHTLRIAVDSDVDVVWIREFDSQTQKVRLLRCTNTPEGPKCEEVKQP